MQDGRYDFGTVRQGERIAHRFVVRNCGVAPLRLSGAALSMPAMTLRVSSPEIVAGGEGSVAVELGTDRIDGPVEAVAQLRWSDLAQPEARLLLAGQVEAPISIEPMPAVFLSTFSGAAAERVLTVRNNEPQALAITHIEHSPHFQVAVAVADPGKVFRLTVRAADGTPVGRYDESLRLHTDLPSAPSIELPLHLWVKPDLYANPEALDFGTLRRDDLKQGSAALATQTFFLTRRSGPFTIDTLEYDATAFEVKWSPAGRSDRYRFDVRLRPTARGPIGGSLRIKTSDPKFREVVVLLSGSLS